MNMTNTLIRRNVKLFFRDKGMFFTSLITPLILLVLYTTFLGNVYRDSFYANLPVGIPIPEKLMDGLVGGQLVSSLLAVSCVTVSFCSNFLMVQDRSNGVIKDLRITPVKHSTLAVSYYAATLICTLIISFVAMVAGLIYMAVIGWYLSLLDVVLLTADVLLMVLFGTALSSVINFFLSTQGQISAVGSIVSSCYGFISGAYMPISSFSPGLQKVIMFLPGTYGTSLLRNHAMGSAIRELAAIGVPETHIQTMKNTLDCSLYFFDQPVSIGTMYIILTATVVLLLGAYILLNRMKKK